MSEVPLSNTRRSDGPQSDLRNLKRVLSGSCPDLDCRKQVLDKVIAASRLMLQANSEEEIEQFLRKTAKEFGFDVFVEFAVQGSVGQERLVAVLPHVPELKRSEFSIDDENAAAQSFRQRSVVQGDHLENCAEQAWSFLDTQTVRSAVCIPLSIDSQSLGVLCIASTTEANIASEAVCAHEAMAGLLSVARCHTRSSSAIAEHRTRLQLAMEATGLGVWELDPATSRVTWSPEVFRILGTSQFDGTFESFRSRIHPDDLTQIEEGETKLYQAGSCTTQFRFQKDDGQTIWVANHVKFFPGGKSGRDIVVGTVQEITEQVTAAAARRESDERLREFVEHIDEMFYIYDMPEKTCTYLSPAYSRLFRIPTPTVPVSSHIPITSVHPDDQASVLSLRTRWFREPTVCIQFRVLWPDGSEHWVADQTFTVRNESGVVMRVVGMARDVTERRLAGERIAAQQAELLQVSRMNTLGMMSSALSHELNQPLSALANFASACDALLQLGSETNLSDLRDYVRQMIAQSIRAGQIVRRLSEFGRKTPTRLSTHSVNLIVDDTITLLGSELRRRQIRCVVECPVEITPIQCDRIQIQQVLVNLITNAADSLEKIDGSARVVVVSVEQDSQNVKISVSDSGPGILPEVRARLFEPFFSTKKNGSGVGLKIVRAIIEAHGGTISVEDNTPKGAKFSVTVPSTSEHGSSGHANG